MPATIPQEIASDVQGLTGSQLVTLFEIDASALPNGAVVYCVPGDFGGTPVEFNGITYSPLPIEAEGFEWTAKGTLPTPILRASNLGGLFTALLVGTDDLLGAVVTRRRTFRQFLDDGADADPTLQFPADIYTINQKTRHTKSLIEWKLSSSFDQEGVKIPGRKVNRSTCRHRYRRWNAATASFDYADATCPYSASANFDISGAPASNAGDRCGLKLTDCKLRFGQHAELPFQAFPGLVRFR